MQTKSFYWLGLTSEGFKVEGTWHARNIQEIKEALISQKIHILKIRPVVTLFGQKKLSLLDMKQLTGVLANLISANIPLLEAFHILGQNAEKKILKNLCQEVRGRLENGYLLSEAFRIQSPQFEGFFYHFIRAGEKTGQLALVLNDIAAYQERSLRLNQKIKKALSYPMMVLFVSITILFLMTVWVIPQFASLFSSVNVPLPFLTRAVLGSVDFVLQWGIVVFFILGIGGVGLRIGIRSSRRVRLVWERAWLGCPGIGALRRWALLARCFQALAIMFQANVPLLEALLVTAEVAHNLHYAHIWRLVHQQIQDGSSLSEALKSTHAFPESIIQFTYIGERSGCLGSFLQKVSEEFSTRIENKSDYFIQLLEPLLILFLCITIGVLVIALYLPIFKLGSIV